MLGRIRQAEKFLALVLFLLTEGSSYMTGAKHCCRAQDRHDTDGSRQDLRVDGGHCAW
jgi:hypothetical protein